MWIESGGEHLCAIVGVPAGGEVREPGAVLLTGANYQRGHRNGMWTRAARMLADRGHPSVRLDYHGTGESTGRLRLDLFEPALAGDIVAASSFLARATGVTQLALAGTCFGALGAVAVSAKIPEAVSVTAFPVPLAVPRDRAAVAARSRMKATLERSALGFRLLSADPVRRLRRRLAAARAGGGITVNPWFRSGLRDFVRRGGRVRFVYGEHTERLAAIRTCLHGLAPELSEDERARIVLDIVPGTALDRYQSFEEQQHAIDWTVATIAGTALPAKARPG